MYSIDHGFVCFCFVLSVATRIFPSLWVYLFIYFSSAENMHSPRQSKFTVVVVFHPEPLGLGFMLSKSPSCGRILMWWDDSYTYVASKAQRNYFHKPHGYPAEPIMQNAVPCVGTLNKTSSLLTCNWAWTLERTRKNAIRPIQHGGTRETSLGEDRNNRQHLWRGGLCHRNKPPSFSQGQGRPQLSVSHISPSLNQDVAASPT